ncbi:hypothetical protein GCM10007063_22000 [Lentibacillus kapialis]|uniref:Uncharacterized protein n=1 Tax=Lentibacillus kapialis TaxID=340214 RepID=A0A917PXL6_9BACI|nr:hypothetical protein GCM10007063_22000 [Lentibacillus kapialis]
MNKKTVKFLMSIIMKTDTMLNFYTIIKLLNYRKDDEYNAKVDWVSNYYDGSCRSRVFIGRK